MGEAKPKPSARKRNYAPNDVRNKPTPPASAAPAVPDAPPADADQRLQVTQQLMRAALANDAAMLRTAIQHAESVGLSNEAAMARAKLDKLSAAPQQAQQPQQTQPERAPAGRKSDTRKGAGKDTAAGRRGGAGQARPRSPPAQPDAKPGRGDKDRRAKQPAAREPESGGAPLRNSGNAGDGPPQRAQKTAQRPDRPVAPAAGPGPDTPIGAVAAWLEKRGKGRYTQAVCTLFEQTDEGPSEWVNTLERMAESGLVDGLLAALESDGQVSAELAAPAPAPRPRAQSSPRARRARSTPRARKDAGADAASQQQRTYAPNDVRSKTQRNEGSGAERESSASTVVAEKRRAFIAAEKARVEALGKNQQSGSGTTITKGKSGSGTTIKTNAVGKRQAAEQAHKSPAQTKSAAREAKTDRSDRHKGRPEPEPEPEPNGEAPRKPKGAPKPRKPSGSDTKHETNGNTQAAGSRSKSPGNSVRSPRSKSPPPPSTAAKSAAARAKSRARSDRAKSTPRGSPRAGKTKPTKRAPELTAAEGDIKLSCRDCEGVFRFTKSEQDFHLQKGFEQPIRCKECRASRKSGRKPGSGESQTAQRSYAPSDVRNTGNRQAAVGTTRGGPASKSPPRSAAGRAKSSPRGPRAEQQRVFAPNDVRSKTSNDHPKGGKQRGKNDRDITCRDCSEPFVFTARAQALHAEHDWDDPIRCQLCRKATRERVAAAKEGRPATAGERPRSPGQSPRSRADRAKSTPRQDRKAATADAAAARALQADNDDWSSAADDWASASASEQRLEATQMMRTAALSGDRVSLKAAIAYAEASPIKESLRQDLDMARAKMLKMVGS